MPDARTDLVSLLQDHIAAKRSSLQRNFRHFGLESYDKHALAVREVVETLQRRATEITSSEMLTPMGKRDAMTVAIQATEKALRSLETNESAKGLERHIAGVRGELFREPPPDDGSALATKADVYRAMQQGRIAQGIFEQLKALTLEERELIAKTTPDRDVAKELESGPPLIRVSEQPHARGVRRVTVEPLIRDEVRDAARLQRARAEHPAEAEKLDELEQLQAAMKSLVGVARENMGQAVRAHVPAAVAGIARSGADVMRIATDGADASIKTVDAALTR